MILECPGVPGGSKSFKEGLEGSVLVRIPLDHTRPIWTLLDPPGPFQTSRPSWNLLDPLDLHGPSRTLPNLQGPFRTLPDPPGPTWAS